MIQRRMFTIYMSRKSAKTLKYNLCKQMSFLVYHIVMLTPVSSMYSIMLNNSMMLIFHEAYVYITTTPSISIPASQTPD